MKLTLLFLLVISYCFTTQSQNNPESKSAIQSESTVIDNTLDSLNLVLTSRPIAGSSRKDQNPVLFLVGNSTMRNGTQGNGQNGQWGWGYFAHEFFNSEKITIENHALGGLSSRSFYERFWSPVVDALQPGDWVIVELGHNDNGPYDHGRARASIPGIGFDSLAVTIQESGEHRTVYSYGEYMRRYIREAQSKGANIILMSITPRNNIDAKTGKTVRSTTHGQWAKEVAMEMQVPFVDLNEISAAKYDLFGQEKVNYHFYGDLIHTSACGAYENAKSAVEGIREYPNLELANYLTPAKMPYTSSVRKGNNPVLFTVGDSTVKNNEKDDDGMWGWGSVIHNLFDKELITIDNQARGGRSSRTYLDEGLWDQVYEAIRPGDYVMIQFGHNDGGSVHTDKARGTLKGSGDENQVFKMEATGKFQVVYTYGWYLRKFVLDVKEKGATPIIISHTPRNQWSSNGKIIRNTDSYGLWAREAAEKAGALFIDLNELSAQKLEVMDKTVVDTYYKNDHTHTSLKGATLNAACVVEGLQQIDTDLKNFIVTPTKKKTKK